MNRMPDQIVDQHRNAANSQGFTHKLNQLLRRQMMSEKTGIDEVEAVVLERERDCVGNHEPELRSFLPEIESSEICDGR